MSAKHQCRHCYGPGPWFVPPTRHRRGICRDCESRATSQERANRVIKLRHESQVERAPQLVCKLCCGLSHRRPPEGCARCGEAFAPEKVEVLLSNANSAWSWARFGDDAVAQ